MGKTNNYAECTKTLKKSFADDMENDFFQGYFSLFT